MVKDRSAVLELEQYPRVDPEEVFSNTEAVEHVSFEISKKVRESQPSFHTIRSQCKAQAESRVIELAFSP